MIGVRVEIRRFVDDSQPGWVECAFMDAHGRDWLFVEKVPVVHAEYLSSESKYPLPGRIACQVMERRSLANGQEILVVDTEQPWGIAATTGETRFDIRPDQLEAFEFGA